MFTLKMVMEEFETKRFEGLKILIEYAFEMSAQVADFVMMQKVCNLWVAISSYRYDWEHAIKGLSALKDLHIQ